MIAVENRFFEKAICEPFTHTINLYRRDPQRTASPCLGCPVRVTTKFGPLNLPTHVVDLPQLWLLPARSEARFRASEGAWQRLCSPQQAPKFSRDSRPKNKQLAEDMTTYPLVNSPGNEKSPFLFGKPSEISYKWWIFHWVTRISEILISLSGSDFVGCKAWVPLICHWPGMFLKC